MCLIPFPFIKFGNYGPFSDTSCRGIPYIENNLNSVIVVCVVVLCSSMTSGHLECTSMTTKNFLFKNGPAKSTCILSHGWHGQIHWCRGASGGLQDSCLE